MKDKVLVEIDRYVSLLKKSQADDGSWDYPFDTGVATDAYMIVLLRSLEMDDEALIQSLVGRILSKQENYGAWKLFADQKNGHVTTTVEAYYALLFSGYVDADAPSLEKAKRYIVAHGGVEKASMFTKTMLALTGKTDWPDVFPVPIEAILLPVSFPINFYDLSVFGRANLTPLAILGNNQFQLRMKGSPDLSGIIQKTRSEQPFDELQRNRELRDYFMKLAQSMASLTGMVGNLEERAIDQAKQYMLDRIEPDGTFYSYFSSTFLMIFALLSLGYSKKDSVIQEAVSGLKSMACEIDGYSHMQYTTADVWNTSLISHALQNAGMDDHSETIQKANQYLLSRQHMKYGDWVVHNQYALPGGWGFSNINTINPDVDDTTASLRSVRAFILDQPEFHQVWDRGVSWTISMQNPDGGWPAFERKVDNKLLNLLPVEKGAFLLLDPSSADLTGRTLEYLGNFTNLNQHHPVVKSGKKWLDRDQREDGSWYGRWGICYIYGTWAALTGYAATGKRMDSSKVKVAVRWLNSIQNEDGGWGESCRSDLEKRYVPLEASTLTHTAWAVDALIAVSSESSPEIERGIQFLIDHREDEDWTTDYPKGQGMGGAFYIHYHSYRYIWPLVALGNYQRKFG